MKSARIVIVIFLLVFSWPICRAGQARKSAAGQPGRRASDAVTALAFSPNGRLLAVGRYQNVDLRDSATGRMVMTLGALEGSVTALAFSANGDVLAAGSGTPGKDGEVELWQTKSGKRLRSLAAHNDMIYGVALRSDDRQLAAVSYDHLVSLWTWGGAANLRNPVFAPRYLRDHTDAVYGVAYSPDGRQLATAAGDRTIKVWDTTTGKRLFTLSESTADQYTVAYRPDGRQLAAGGVDKTLRVWNLESGGGTLSRSAFAHDGAILRVLYSHDGKSLFTCGEDNTVKQWDADTLTERAPYPKQPDWPQSLALSPDDRTLAVGRYDGSLALYDTRTHENAMRINSRLTKHDVALRRQIQLPARCSTDTTPTDLEVTRQPGNESVGAAQRIPVPAVVTGVLWNGKADTLASSHYYRFPARKGETLVLDVLARRAGSLLDSEIEVLDVRGGPIERAVLRSVGQTELTLSDRDSVSPGIRLLLRPDFNMNDYVLAGRELLQIYTLPKGPDDDYQFRSYSGQRTGFLGTTPEYHTIGAPVYKVEIHPPGSVLAPNGMPLTHLNYKNDDGGPLYGRDSYLEFTPPADGDYVVRLTDVRRQQGEKFTYKLRIHSPRPDFNIHLNPAVITVPKDGSARVSVECERIDGFDGEIAVRLEGLPSGFTTTEGVIEAGETGASIWIAAAPGTIAPKMDVPSAYRVLATAAIAGKEVAHTIEPDSKNRHVAIGAASNVQVVTNLQDVSLHPGGEAVVEARITRLNGFKGRIPLDIRNLPYGVRVDDIGLNGVLITENETSRKFVVRCEPWVKRQSRLFYVTANVEGGVSSTAQPLMLHIASSSVSRR